MVASNKECPYLQAPSQSSGALLYGSVCAGGGGGGAGGDPTVRPLLGFQRLEQVLTTAGPRASEEAAPAQQPKAPSDETHKDHVPQGQDLVPNSEVHPGPEGKSGSPEPICLGVEFILIPTLMATVSRAGRPTLEAQEGLTLASSFPRSQTCPFSFREQGMQHTALNT